MKYITKIWILMLFLSPWFVFSFSLEQHFLSETQDFKKDDLLEDYSESSIGWNIYSQAHKLTQQTEQFAEREGFEYTSNYFNDFFDCNIKQEDIYNIYAVSNPSFVYIQSGLSWKEQVDRERQNFIDSCKNVVACLGDEKIEDIDWYNQSTRNLCMQTVGNIMNKAQKSIYADQTHEFENIWDERFMDGSLDTSPYDLLIDVQNIWDVLFEDNADPQDISFFLGGDSWATGWWGWNWDNDNWWNGGDNDNWDNWDNGDDDDNWTNWWNWNWDNDNWWNGGDDDNWDNWDNGDDDDNWTNWWNWDDNWWPFGSDWDNIIQNFVCDESWQIIDPDQQLEWDNEQAQQQSDDISDDWESVVEMLPESVPTDDLDGGAAGISSALGNVWDDLFDEDIEDVDYDSFVGELGGMWFTDCMNVWDPDDIFWMRICLLYSETKWIVDQRTIDATESAMDEINNVLLNLKRSWSIMKHKKTDEMWEIWLQDIDFGKIFSFDIVLKQKPVFPWQGTYKDEARIAIIKEQNKSYQKNILQMNESLDLKEEKNKYMLRWNPERMEAAKSPSGSAATRRQNIEYALERKSQLDVDYEQIPENLQSSNTYKSMDMFHSFIEFNEDFFEQLNSTLSSIEDISRWFKERVVSGGG